MCIKGFIVECVYWIFYKVLVEFYYSHVNPFRFPSDEFFCHPGVSRRSIWQAWSKFVVSQENAFFAMWNLQCQDCRSLTAPAITRSESEPEDTPDDILTYFHLTKKNYKFASNLKNSIEDQAITLFVRWSRNDTENGVKLLTQYRYVPGKVILFP